SISLSLNSLTTFFFLIIPHPPRSTLFPYTTLFRSQLLRQEAELLAHRPVLGERFAASGEMGAQPDQLLGDIDPVRHERDLDRERSEEHTSELQSRGHLVCRLLLEKKKKVPFAVTSR